jgi:non-ribosomal peptide synthetase component F
LHDGVTAAPAAPAAEPNGRRSDLRGLTELELAVPREVAAALGAARRQFALKSVLRAAWALLVARFTGDDDVVFGVAAAPWRAAGAGSPAVLPFRVRVAGELCVHDFLTTVHALELASRPYEDTAPPALAHELASVAPSLKLESVLALETQPSELVFARDVPTGVRAAIQREERAPPLTLRVLGTAEGDWSLQLACERGRFRAGMAERLADAFVFVLEQLLANGNGLVRDVHAVRPETRRRLIADFNATTRDFAAELLIHEPFEARARAEPDAVAVETQTAALSYAELDALSNRLAHALRARGARPGVRVGICLERGVLLVAALLAASKSGAAYVPLDPSYPAERLQRIATDADPAVIVTESAFADRFAGPLLLLDSTELSAFSPLSP